MRKTLALLLVLMMMAAYMTVPAMAGEWFLPGGPENDNSGSGGSGPAVGHGQQKEFAVPTAPTAPAEETFPVEEPIVPATEQTAAPETEVIAETEIQTVPETVAEMIPQPAEREPMELPKVEGVKELAEAVAMIKVLTIVIIGLALIICLLLAGFVFLYAKGIIVLRKKTAPVNRRVTAVQMQEERTVQPAAWSEPPRMTGYPQAPMTQYPERTMEENLPPIGQTVILRKTAEQYEHMNRKDRRE